jgi:hypothetical protein
VQPQENQAHASTSDMFFNQGPSWVGRERSPSSTHCPTNNMLADHFTKPVQGSHFRRLRCEFQGMRYSTTRMMHVCMGWDRPCLKTKTDVKSGTPSPQECVVKKVNRANAKAILISSEKVTAPAVSPIANGKILATRCLTRKS